MNIFLRYEITARELDANILIGLIAASRGHRALVCDWPMMMRGILLRRRQPGFVHMNSLTPGKSTPIFHDIFKFFGYRVSSMDQEAGIQLISYDSFAKVRFGEETVSGADLIFCWGCDDYKVLQSLYPKYSERIILTGSPRVDLWRPRFAGVYSKPKQVVEPFVLIVSSLQGPLMFTPFHKRLISRRSSGYLDPNPEIEAQLVGEYKESADLMLAYLKLIRFLSLNQPDLGILVKAHPDEDPESWRGILGETVRARVDTETPTSQLVRESVAVILSGSTVAFEAELSESPLISFQPIATPYRALGFAESLGFVAKNVEEVDSILKSITNPGIGNILNPRPAKSKINIRQKVYFDDEELAAERMVDAWETALKNEASWPAGSWSFFMSKEGLQYFVASAFPLLTSFLVRVGQRKLDAGPRRNYKRPPLDRKPVRARIEEMRSILGLQDSVSFRFRGRRGIVIEPIFRRFSRG